MAATIRDVAKLAQVSPSTVSAVLNNKGYISDDARSRVMAAIRELNYTPLRSARNLTKRTSGNIGFIVSESHFTRAEPFYTRVFLGTEFQAEKNDLYVLLTTVPDQYQSPDELPRFLREQNVDGVIIAGSVPDRLLHDVLKRDVPVVLVDFGDEAHKVPRVLIDNTQGIQMVMDHLISQGHKQFGYVGGDEDHPSANERSAAFKQVLVYHGFEIREQWIRQVESPSSSELGARAFRKIWKSKEKPTAIVCFNDATAIGVAREARKVQVAIPEELSITGFDDVESAYLHDPPLTTVCVFKEDLGTIGVQTLVSMIGKTDHRVITTRVGVEFIERESTAPPKR